MTWWQMASNPAGRPRMIAGAGTKVVRLRHKLITTEAGQPPQGLASCLTTARRQTVAVGEAPTTRASQTRLAVSIGSSLPYICRGTKVRRSRLGCSRGQRPPFTTEYAPHLELPSRRSPGNTYIQRRTGILRVHHWSVHDAHARHCACAITTLACRRVFGACKGAPSPFCVRADMG